MASLTSTLWFLTYRRPFSWLGQHLSWVWGSIQGSIPETISLHGRQPTQSRWWYHSSWWGSRERGAWTFFGEHSNVPMAPTDWTHTPPTRKAEERVIIDVIIDGEAFCYCLSPPIIVKIPMAFQYSLFDSLKYSFIWEFAIFLYLIV